MKILSLGMGVQSVTLYFMSCYGEIDRFDYSIFADPKAESKLTYEYVDWLINWQKKNDGIPIIVAGEKNIYNDLINGTNSTGNRFASIPCYTKNADGSIGILRRQCTSEYKIDAVEKAVRKIYNLKKHARNILTNFSMGISLDEIERMRIPQEKWKTFSYPLIEKRMTRTDCEAWLKRKGLPIPPKSSCFFCSFNSNARWLDMKRNRPDEWNESVKLDKLIRNSKAKGVESSLYLHPSCVPLDQVTFKNENQFEIWQSFKNECQGMCGN